MLEKGMTPSPEADPATLCRRLYFDLIGLPPTPEELEAFFNPTAAIRKPQLPRSSISLQASPAYGERWAKMWLDLARYADSTGYGSDKFRLNIWPYRDWVINAFNRNLPYDQFTIEQIAGDLLPNATTDQIAATAFHRNTMTNFEGGMIEEEFRVAAVKDRIATTGQVWMGLTVGCAQCHSHKFDPISQKDYYRLLRGLQSDGGRRPQDEEPKMPLPTPEEIAKTAEVKEEIAALQEKMKGATPEFEAEQRAWETQMARARRIGRRSSHSRSRRRAGSRSTRSRMARCSPWAAIIRRRIPTRSSAHGLARHHRVSPRSAAGRFAAGAWPGPRGQWQRGAERIALPRLCPRTQNPSARSMCASRSRTRPKGSRSRRSKSSATARMWRCAARPSQSSTDFGGDAKRAIDGKTDGDFFKGQVRLAHRNTEKDPWWEVDLGGEVGDRARRDLEPHGQRPRQPAREFPCRACWMRRGSRLWETDRGRAAEPERGAQAGGRPGDRAAQRERGFQPGRLASGRRRSMAI